MLLWNTTDKPDPAGTEIQVVWALSVWAVWAGRARPGPIASFLQLKLLKPRDTEQLNSGHREGQAQAPVGSAGFSGCSWGRYLSEWNLLYTDAMPVGQMGTIKYALTASPATTASHIQVDFSVSSEGLQGNGA